MIPQPTPEHWQQRGCAALRAAAAHASEQARRRCFDLYGFRWRLLVDEHLTAAHLGGELDADAFAYAIGFFNQYPHTPDLAAQIAALKGNP